MKHLLAFVFSLSAFYLATFAETADYQLNVQDFNSLNVIDNINVEYKCVPDSAGWVVFSCEPDVAAELIFTNNKATLDIDLSYEGMEPPGLPVIRVYSSALKTVENSGDSTVTVHSMCPVENVKIRVIGNGAIDVRGVHATSLDAVVAAGCGRISVEGRAKKASYKNVGTGTVDASALDAAKVKCKVFGTGPILCRATESLGIYGAGSGKVHYTGNPEKVKNRSIGIKAVQEEEVDDKQ